jgi:hypothetical protein
MFNTNIILAIPDDFPTLIVDPLLASSSAAGHVDLFHTGAGSS